MSKLDDDEIRRIYREVAGTDLASPALSADIRDEEHQRTAIAKSIALMAQRCHPTVLISMLVVALAFLADEHNVDREHLIRLLRDARQRQVLEMTGTGAPIIAE